MTHTCKNITLLEISVSVVYALKHFGAIFLLFEEILYLDNLQLPVQWGRVLN